MVLRRWPGRVSSIGELLTGLSVTFSDLTQGRGFIWYRNYEAIHVRSSELSTPLYPDWHSGAYASHDD